MQAHTNYTRYFPTRIYADLHWFSGFIAVIRVHLWNPWLITCSTIVENPLQIGLFLQNEANLRVVRNEGKLSFYKGL
jgi:hypothetical protein